MLTADVHTRQSEFRGSTTTKVVDDLMALQDCRAVMKYVVDTYIIKNGLGRVAEDMRAKIIAEAYLYHYRASLEQVQKRGMAGIDWLLNQLPPTNSSLLDRAFSLGVCRSDARDTSSAMKYLLCKGETIPVGPRMGIAFQRLHAMHQVRLYEAFGQVAVLCQLTKQVPQTFRKDGIDYQEIDGARLKRDFDGMKSSYQDATVFVIIQPEEDNAAGPDVIVVELKETKNRILLFQVKNLKQETCSKSWTRLKPKVLRSLFAAEAEDCAKVFEEALDGEIEQRFVQHSLPIDEMFRQNGEVFTCMTDDEYLVLPKEAVQPTMETGALFGTMEEEALDEEDQNEGETGV